MSEPKVLKVEPGAKSGSFRFRIGDYDVSHLIDYAEVRLYNEQRRAEMTIEPVELIPENVEVQLFTGGKTNGCNRGSNASTGQDKSEMV